jgi:hypothetical protein
MSPHDPEDLPSLKDLKYCLLSMARGLVIPEGVPGEGWKNHPYYDAWCRALMELHHEQPPPPIELGKSPSYAKGIAMHDPSKIPQIIALFQLTMGQGERETDR